MQELSDEKKAQEIQRLLDESLQYQNNIIRLNQDPEKNAEAIKNNRIVLFAAAVRILLLLPKEINYFYFTGFPDIGAVRFPDRQNALDNLLAILESNETKSSDQDNNATIEDSEFDTDALAMSDLQIVRVMCFDYVLKNWDKLRKINPRIASQEMLANQPRYIWEMVREKVFKIIVLDVGVIRIYNDQLARDYALFLLTHEGEPPSPELHIPNDFVQGERYV